MWTNGGSSLPASYLRFKLNRPQCLCDERKLVNARSRIFRASQIESLLLNRAVRRHGLPYPSTLTGRPCLLSEGRRPKGGTMKVEFVVYLLGLALVLALTA
jgi:hypothetical protein